MGMTRRHSMVVKRVLPCLLVLALAAWLLGSATGCYAVVTGSGDLETREMDFSGFTELEVGYAFEVEISAGASYSVTITVDDNLFQHLDVSQTGETLHIGLKGNTGCRNCTLRAAVTMPQIVAVELSGASSGTIGGFSTSDSLDVDLSGASSLDMTDMDVGVADLHLSGASNISGSIDTDDVAFDLSGASSLELEGSGGDASISASGASHGGLEGFQVEDADVQFSGASTGTVNASGTLDVDLSGASVLYYVNSPTLGSVNISGASSLQQK